MTTVDVITRAPRIFEREQRCDTAERRIQPDFVGEVTDFEGGSELFTIAVDVINSRSALFQCEEVHTVKAGGGIH